MLKKEKGNMPKQKETLMLLDCAGIGHTVKHSTKNLSFGGSSTGIIYGFLKKLISLSREIKPDQIVFAWDSKKSLRKKIYPNYKKKRQDKTEKEKQLNEIAFTQFELLEKDILPKLGFKNIFSLEGYEADDIIGEVVNTTPNYIHKVIVSRDNDMYQLLSDSCSMFIPVGNKWYTHEDFKKEWNLKYNMWLVVKCIAGCKTDEVAGVAGVGEKTAIKYINKELSKDSKIYKRIEKSKELIRRNFDLVYIPFLNEEKPFLKDWYDLEEDKITFKKLRKVCEKYGMTSFLKKENINEWLKLFQKEK